MPLLSLSFFALERTIDMMLYNDWFALGVIMVFSGCRTATELDPPIERFLNAIIVILLVNHDLFVAATYNNWVVFIVVVASTNNDTILVLPLTVVDHHLFIVVTAILNHIFIGLLHQGRKLKVLLDIHGDAESMSLALS